MSYEQRDNSGTLFNNREAKATNERAPDYKGSIMVSGEEFWLSAWIKEGQKGKFMSLSVQPKEAKAPAKPARQSRPSRDDFDSDVPF
jgi:hypothetical protein